MVRWIVESSLKYKYLVLAFAVIVMVMGFISLQRMPVDVFPEFEPPKVEIQAEALGLSADEVESLITLNLEEFLAGTPWLETIRSESVPGLSSITLIFKPGTDIMRARQVVQESLSMAYTMPNVSKPPVMLQPLSATKRAMMIGLSSKTLSDIDLSVLSRWTIKPRLLGVPGVANVLIWGQKNRQLQVLIDPERLQKNGITQDQIIRTTGDALWVSPLSFLSASVPGTGGWIDTPNHRLGIRHELPISSPEDLAKVPVHGSDKLLGDVAEVVVGHPLLIGDAYLNEGTGIILVIEKFPWADTLKVTQGVEEALDALKAGLPGLEVDTNIFKLSNYINRAIGNLALALIMSGLLVALVLGMFLYNWRATLISLLAIPLSILCAVVLLYLLGSSINLMVLAGFGIALGVLVDDAIIDVENIMKGLKKNSGDNNKGSSLSVILKSSLEVRSPIIYATLIIVLSVLPVFSIGGFSGAFFHPLALSYSISLLASLVVALTVTPALCLLLLDKSMLKSKGSPSLSWLNVRYKSAISKIVVAPNKIFIVSAAIFLLGLALWPFLGQSLLPTFKERDILVELDGPPGTSHDEMSRIILQLSKHLRKIPGVQNVVTHNGRAITGDLIVGINSSQLWVSIDPRADYDQTVDSIKESVSVYQGFDRDVLTYLDERIRSALSGTSEQIAVRLYGPKREILSEKAEEIQRALSEINGITDLQIEGQTVEPHVEIQVDLEKARPHGIKPGDVRRSAATVFAGIEAGYLFEGQKVFDVIVWGQPEARHSITDIKELLIETKDGGHVRLDEVADVKIVPSPTVINHEAISPHIDIVANVKNSDLGTVARQVEKQLKNIDFPIEYHPEILGEYAERLAAQNRIFWVGIAAAIGIYLLLQACFGSWRLATLAFLALPTALVGGIFAVILNGSVVSLGSLVGFLAVLGISARNGIMLINHYQHLEHKERVDLGANLVIRGAQERLPHILMTASTTAFALLPFVFLGDREGLEIIYPMAIVIIGGLVTSTLLITFIIPPLYLLLGSTSKPEVIENH